MDINPECRQSKISLGQTSSRILHYLNRDCRVQYTLYTVEVEIHIIWTIQPKFYYQHHIFSLNTIYGYRPISPNLPEKTFAISQVLAEIIPLPISPNVPISPNFFEIYISNYFLSVMNDVIYRIHFPKSSLFNFYPIASGGVFNSTIL